MAKPLDILTNAQLFSKIVYLAKQQGVTEFKLSSDRIREKHSVKLHDYLISINKKLTTVYTEYHRRFIR